MHAAAAATAGGATVNDGPPLGPPADVDVFAAFLRSLRAMSADPDGPFRREQGAPGADTPAETAATPSDRLSILRTTIAALANSGAISSLIEVYDALLQFTLEIWPGNVARVDDTMDGCAQSLQVRLVHALLCLVFFAVKNLLTSRRIR